MFFWNLLSTETEPANKYPWVLMIGAFALIVVMMIFNNRSQKKRQKEMEETLNALKPGSKVKTIGGICGVVVEVCPEDNTFVLETGSETYGKSYIKLDKQAVYQTDAKKEAVEEAPAAEEETDAPVEEAPVFEEETVEEPVEEPVEVAEETAEVVEAPVENVEE